jgi:hypothetical protein
MQDEADITICGVMLTDAESMTVRVMIDTLAEVLAEGLEEEEGRAVTDMHLASLSRIQEPARAPQAANTRGPCEPP